MSRQNIFEISKNKYNIVKEMNKIKNLYNDKLCYTKTSNYYGNEEKKFYTVENIVDKYCIYTWKQRGSYLNCKEIRNTLEIPEQYTNYTSSDDIIKSLEYYVNIFTLFIDKKPKDVYVTNTFNMVIQNILILLKHINYKHIFIPKEEKILLIPKNPEATAVAEISSEETALAILKYNHSSLKGNLEEKRKLLYQIALEYEPLLKTQIDGYKDFFSKTNALLNNLNIRHNNKATENNKNKVIDLDEQELEKWYDELYQLLLFCVLIEDNVKRKDKVNEFLETLKGGVNA